MARGQPNWGRDELIAALDLYCRTPFGRLHHRNPDVIALAKAIGRTPSAVAMKLVNFASFDPAHRARGVHGLTNASRADRSVWEEFENDWESLAVEGAAIRASIGLRWDNSAESKTTRSEESLTETARQTKVRLVQSFFRDAVLASYDFSCAFCGLCLSELLNASHIIPWSCDVARRADPRNGLALCAIHDRAFDRGLMTVRPDLMILVSSRVKIKAVTPVHQVALLDIEGKLMRPPARFSPDESALAYHNERVFR